jgi:hypothetical protein
MGPKFYKFKRLFEEPHQKFCQTKLKAKNPTTKVPFKIKN